MEVSSFVDHLSNLAEYQDQIAHLQQLPAKTAGYAELGQPLHPHLERALQQAGMLPLYKHQAAAVEMARSGKNVIIATPAASGKSLCYNVPVLQSLLDGKLSRALYMFPTKALAQDQLRNLSNLASLLPIKTKMATYDGDTPQHERAGIRRRAQIIITNPDMLHLGMLPNHSAWTTFLRHLKYVIVDEAHIYRGIFGANVGNVMRRLRRLLDLYRADPCFICSSATIANPKAHAETLTGLPFEMIDEDGSPHGRKQFILWNPPVIDITKSRRRSANSESAFLLAELVRKQIRTITFARTRKLTELIYTYARQQLEGSGLHDLIRPYRAGYLAKDRRRIEQELFQGQLMGVVATTALELGIDIGDLDAAVLTGYPGSISGTWQQAGRSGRRAEESLSFLIGLDNPLDQYIMRHPDVLFSRRFENALTDPFNRYILKAHLLCAAWESPLSERDAGYWDDNAAFNQIKDELKHENLLIGQTSRLFPAPSIAYPAETVNIRSSSSSHFAIVDITEGNRLLETIESSQALSQAHPGAIYLHQGKSYLVTKLDLISRMAHVEAAEVPYYTQAREVSDLQVLNAFQTKRTPFAYCHLGEVEVTSMVLGFKRKMQFTEEVINEEALEMPSQSFRTVALWFDIPVSAFDRVSEMKLDLAGGLHAAEHAAIAMLPLFALCDRNDIGGVSTLLHSDTGRAQVFIYDAYPGGTGIAEKGFELIQQLWRATLQAVAECPCEDGCPSCIQSPKCGNNNHPLDKVAAKVILEELSR